jgi:hypothetical protein
MNTLSAMMISLALLGCEPHNNDCNREIDDQALIQATSSLSLADLYDYHVHLCHVCTPSRTTLAWEVAKFGSAARQIAFVRSRSGDTRDFEAALTVIGSLNVRFNRVCTDAERHLLEARTRALFGQAVVEIELRSVREACAAVTVDTQYPPD